MIRKATYEDATAIARVHVGTWRTAYAGIVSDDYLASLSEAKRITSWQQQLRDGRTIILVAEENKEIIGFVSAGRSRNHDGADDSEIYAIYVLARYAGRGVGSSLLAAMEDSLPLSPTTTLWVLRDNPRAIQFYERFGYRPDGAQKEIRLGAQVFWEVRYRKNRPSHSVW
jgi:ribosomal protein S18 acetylase RimI-like enzyme